MAGDVTAVVGIGINLAWHPADIGRPATHLAAHGADVTPEAMLQALAPAMQGWLDVWQGGAGFARVRAAWLERAGPVGEAGNGRYGCRAHRRHLPRSRCGRGAAAARYARPAAQGHVRRRHARRAGTRGARADGQGTAAQARCGRRRIRVHGARRHRPDRHELLPVRARARGWPAMADGRSRHHLPRGRERSGRRRHPARYPLCRGREGGSRGHRADARPRGPHRRGDRALAAPEGADLRHAVHRRPAAQQARRIRARAEAADQGGGAERPLRCRAVLAGADLGGALDPGVERAGGAHAARAGAAHRRLEDRPDAGDRRANRQRPADARSAPRA